MSSLNLARSDRVLVGILLPFVLVATILLFHLLPREKTGGVLRQPSTFFTARYGAKASYATLERLGFPVGRLRRAPDVTALANARTLFLLAPVVPIDKASEERLLDWVRAGHVLVISPSAVERFRDVIDARPEGGTLPGTNPWLAGDSAFLDGVRRLSMPSGAPWTLAGAASGPLEHADVSTFWKDSRGDLGVTVSVGRGLVVALASAYPLSNAGLLEADDATLLGNLARLRVGDGKGETILFDEYQLGFDDRDTSPVALAKLVLGGSVRFAAAQALAVIALFLFASAIRFGSPVGHDPAPRRAHGEFVDAAGRLLYEAGAAGLVQEKLLEDFRANARRLLHLDDRADDARIEEALVARRGAEACASFLKAKTATARTGKEALECARELHGVLETLARGP